MNPSQSGEGDEALPWWAESGLHFHCTACGECCTGAPGYVWIEKAELEPMAKALGLSTRRFRALYARRVKGRLSLQERENGDCVLLKDGKCTVYGAKPVRCSTYPFWAEVLSAPEEWQDAKRRCEGIDQGAHYDREAIERLLTGDERPLLARQALVEETASHAGDSSRPVVGVADGAADASGADAPRWDRALRALERLYGDLERELPRYGFTCAASGKCCDFDASGHRLYVSTLEAEYFFRNTSGRANQEPRHCPAWGADRLCTARDGRMLGCRVYFCPPYPVMPPDDVYERYHQRLVALHERYGIAYRYQDILAWAAEHRPV